MIVYVPAGKGAARSPNHPARELKMPSLEEVDRKILSLVLELEGWRELRESVLLLERYSAGAASGFEAEAKLIRAFGGTPQVKDRPKRPGAAAAALRRRLRRKEVAP